ncbi:MAG TPA: hypothetical protein GX008_01450 [Firmicutes bacterium]|nr:MAG: hypothetical protein AA931_06785 [Peptococcaceae bacterium 1109]HHT72359.1 hypothetical protein [Bacillota bacterium]
MRRLRNLWTHLTEPHIYWRLFSLALAVILWLLAAGEGDLGGTERVFSLPLTARNLPADQALIDPLPVARVRLRGLSPILALVEDDLQAFIDLSGAEEGRSSYEVEVPAPVGVEVVSIAPARVTVRTEQVLADAFPVRVGLLDVYPRALTFQVKPNPAEVLVTAPRSIVAQVDQVVAYISVDEIADDLTAVVPLTAIDQAGRPVQNVQINPQEITLTIEQVYAEEPEGES